MTLILPGSSETAAVELFPLLRPLLDLKLAAWKFLPFGPEDEYLDGFRRWPGPWTDSIRFRDESDVLAIRTDPDNRITWERTDSLVVIVGELMLLPHPGDRLAPRLAKGRGPR